MEENYRETIKGKLIIDLLYRSDRSLIYQRIYLLYRNTDVLSCLNSLWQETKGDPLCAILGGNAKGRVVLSEATHKVQEAVTVLKPCLDWSAS